MKKILILLTLICVIASTSIAQEVVVKKEDKVKRTSTAGQKIHNIFHKKKHYSGYKVKHIKKVEKVHK